MMDLDYGNNPDSMPSVARRWQSITYHVWTNQETQRLSGHKRCFPYIINPWSEGSHSQLFEDLQYKDIPDIYFASWIVRRENPEHHMPIFTGFCLITGMDIFFLRNNQNW